MRVDNRIVYREAKARWKRGNFERGRKTTMFRTHDEPCKMELRYRNILDLEKKQRYPTKKERVPGEL